ncbi:uroporphyrinogen decarboxylase [Acidisphaera sp. L21]|uniref:uroporphyrinogen decarboxylase n=1 Tax=Acidisphaera sp. L21 TaxID=1641851 RepID=UPI00131AF055|nr:uroporphyrinogen decarboxylase [Acidisphaera sp. L21]
MKSSFLRVLAGEPVWPPPVWLMRQAGRYLPEYRSVRAQAGGFMDLCLNPALATEVTLQPIRRFGFDAAILFCDILMLPHALGQDLRYAEGEGPLLAPIRDATSFAKLDTSRAADVTAPIMQAVSRIRAELPPDKALIGFAGSPWTVACYMVEGHGSKEFAAVRGLAYRDPPLFDALIALLVDQTVSYLLAMVDAGADTVMLFDSWAGVLPAAQFRRFVIEPTRQIVAGLRAVHPDLPVIGFPRLAGSLLGEYTRATGVQAVGIDTSMDPAWAASTVPSTVAVQGNMDPLALVAGGQALVDAAQAVLQAWRGRPGIFNLGHGIVPETPPEHVAALMDLIRRA